MTKEITPEQRFAAGQERRKQMRRLAHATWQSKLRKRTANGLLQQSMRGRLPALNAIKFERMAASPFGYFRGAVPVMAYDLSLVPNTGLVNQICGDAHVRNLGAFAAPDGQLVFDINDFDETTAGPFEWDVKRLATSLVLAARAGGAAHKRESEGAEAFLRSYSRFVGSFAEMAVLDLARYQVHRLRDVEPLSAILAKAERSTPLHTLDVLTEPKGSGAGRGKKAVKAGKKGAKVKAEEGEPRGRVFRSEPPLLERVPEETANGVLKALTKYGESLQPERRHFLEFYRPVDVAFKVVGTGSVGLRDFCVYLEGNGPGDPLFLQVKEETTSAYAPYVARSRMAPRQEGERVVYGQRAMQLQSDPFLGWTQMKGRDYLVRQLNDHKASIQIEDLKLSELVEYAAVCGEMLARGHARSGDACLLSGYIGSSGSFEEGILGFAASYADQTEKDWKELVRSRKK